MIWRANKTTLCRCLCDCGNTVIVRNVGLLHGNTQSCGCLQREKTSLTNTKDFSGYISEWGTKLIEPYAQNERGVWLWKCKCGFCGSYFYELPAHVLSGSHKSCGCQKRSAGESFIERFLRDNSVLFAEQFSFPDCRDKQRLLFDFAVFDSNHQLIALIEYDGQQHFKSVELFGGDEAYKTRQQHDEIKNQYCANHYIPLYRIPYTMSPTEIKSLLTNIINP